MNRFLRAMRQAAGIAAVICVWNPIALAQSPVLRAGPMVGHVDVVEAMIWAQTANPAEVRVKYWREGQSPKRSEPVATSRDSYCIAKILLTGLEENARYQYRLIIDGVEIERPYPQQFQTQALWQWRTKPPDFRFAVGSCFYVNDQPYDRPGSPYGGSPAILGEILKQKPQLMIWLGDNVYYRESDFTPTRMNYRMMHTRATPELQPLLASVAHYAIWDDHDFGPNDSNRSYVFKEEALRLQVHYWANPQFGMPDTPGCFGKMSWSDVDFFFLDNRYYRAPNKLKGPDKDYLGAKQLQWLKDALVSSHATFKLIISGNQILNRVSPYECYCHYAGEHREFMSWLQDSGVEGVVVISGDRHFSEMLMLARPNRYPLYEYTNSPLTGGMPKDLGVETNNPLRVKGSLMLAQRNFGIVEVAGPLADRRLVFKTIGADGRQKWSFTIKRSQLQ